MMKKVLAGAIIVYGLFMGFVIVNGFVKKQSDEKQTSSNGAQSRNDARSNSPAPEAPDSSSKTYSKAEIAMHASENDCWLLIDGTVYDVTKFISEHPGGAREILNICGQDATNAFQTQGGQGDHSNQAQDMLQDYTIGSVE